MWRSQNTSSHSISGGQMFPLIATIHSRITNKLLFQNNRKLKKLLNLLILQHLAYLPQLQSRFKIIIPKHSLATVHRCIFYLNA